LPRRATAADIRCLDKYCRRKEYRDPFDRSGSPDALAARSIKPLALEAIEQHLRDFKPTEVSVLTRLLERMVMNGARHTDDSTDADD
jgi:hypothetical protein